MTPAERLRAATALFRRYLKIEATYDAGDSVPTRQVVALHRAVRRWLIGKRPAPKKRKARP